jgi:putative FmdB family regulatory protein
MPIYEYQCSACDAVSAEMRAIADRENRARCKNCGAPAHHILSSVNVGKKSLSERYPPTRNPGTGGIQITDCIFKDSNVGISVPKGAKLITKRNQFIRVKKPMEWRDK